MSYKVRAPSGYSEMVSNKDTALTEAFAGV